MAAGKTLSQIAHSDNSIGKLIIPRHGIICIFGYGVEIRVDRGHLLLKDGIGADRRYARLPRVDGLQRLVCISEDGYATLSALKWLADVGASFVLLNRDGKILLTTGPTAPSDARLRRAQNLAIGNGVGVEISRALIDAKLRGQERTVRERLKDSTTAEAIAAFREKLQRVEIVDEIRWLEAQAAVAYFGVLRDIPVLWPKMDLPRIPEHWRKIGSRRSPLSGGPRLAITPFHGILNYCFALLESETRLALTALGLDPGLGFGLHTDAANRDSLALDVLEPVRPQVEDWLLAWIMREPLRRADFFETSTGNCRLMSHLCAKLSETAPVWSKLVAPWAEFVTQSLWSSTSQSKSVWRFKTPLTQSHRRKAKGCTQQLLNIGVPRPETLCRGCGKNIKTGRSHCHQCARGEAKNRMLQIARLGRAATHTEHAEAQRSATQRRQRAALKAWQSSEHPSWPTEEVYRRQIQPTLRSITVSVIASALNVSLPYATQIRAGRCRPHPRHWQALAEIAKVTPTL